MHWAKFTVREDFLDPPEADIVLHIVGIFDEAKQNLVKRLSFRKFVPYLRLEELLVVCT
jgi:hypothetical protein